MLSMSADDLLTPSEVVFLTASQFASKGGLLDKYKLLDTEVEVSKKQLSTQIFTAALLANQAVGAIQLRGQEKKALFGLRTTQLLYAEPASAATPWPEGSLESAIQPAAERMKAHKGQHEVKNVVLAVLKEDQADPHSFAIDTVKFGLAQRGLVTKTEEKKLKVFRVAHYSLPPGTSELAAAKADSVRQLLAEFRNSHPSEWDLLRDQIDAGIQLRRKQDDSDGGD